MNYILKSRRGYSSSEEFRDEFIDSLTPGVISRDNFIQWEALLTKKNKYQSLFNFFKQISFNSRAEFIENFSDSLMSADDASSFIKLAFELLGHTGKNYVSNRDYVDFRKFSQGEKTEEGMLFISELIFDLGLVKILNLEIEDYFMGVQVGLESHRRKNVGGAAFSLVVLSELNDLQEKLKQRGFEVLVEKEDSIFFLDGLTSKTVDYSLTFKDKKIGIEINFYTASGSKPTEIKRSYGLINSELQKVNTMLVWITDGVGYLQMKKSLKEASDIHRNTYNFLMFRESFEEDVVDFLSSN